MQLFLKIAAAIRFFNVTETSFLTEKNFVIIYRIFKFCFRYLLIFLFLPQTENFL